MNRAESFGGVCGVGGGWWSYEKIKDKTRCASPSFSSIKRTDHKYHRAPHFHRESEWERGITSEPDLLAASLTTSPSKSNQVSSPRKVSLWEENPRPFCTLFTGRTLGKLGARFRQMNKIGTFCLQTLTGKTARQCDAPKPSESSKSSSLKYFTELLSCTAKWMEQQYSNFPFIVNEHHTMDKQAVFSRSSGNRKMLRRISKTKDFCLTLSGVA